MSLRTTFHAAFATLLFIGASVAPLLGQSAYDPQGGEFSITGALPGDQVNASLGLGPAGGYLVWQDNHTDGDGSGISAVRLDSSGTAAFDVFRVNSIGAGNQENPAVARLKNGSHFIVWQGGAAARQDILGQVLNPDGVFASPADILVNSHVSSGKLAPAVAALEGGNAVVTWASYAQDDAANPLRVRRGLQGVYARLFSPAGVALSPEFQVNQTIEFNQRTPAVAGLEDGSFIAVWITERLSGFGESEELVGVDVMGRIFNGLNGAPLGSEFQINTSTNLCAHPSVTGVAGGGFTVAWSERDLGDVEASWDISARHFSSALPASGQAVMTVNSYTYGDQYRPVLRGAGDQQLIVWSSMGQDGSHEGVFGQFLARSQKLGAEFQANTTSVSRQFYPTLAAQSENSFTVVWSSFVGGVGGVDLIAQRYAVGIPKPGAPVVSALSSFELLIAWPQLAGFEVAEYLLYINGQPTPVATDDIFHRLSGLLPGSRHTVRLAYRLADGRVSPISDEVAGTTWGADQNFDGMPDDWQRLHFGDNPALWPSPWVDSDGDGVSNRDEFLAGTNPNDAASVLKVALLNSPQGWRIRWETMPGLIYRVQTSENFNHWTALGGLRFAAGHTDSIFIEPSNGMAYYRIIRIR